MLRTKKKEYRNKKGADPQNGYAKINFKNLIWRKNRKQMKKPDHKYTKSSEIISVIFPANKIHTQNYGCQA